MVLIHRCRALSLLLACCLTPFTARADGEVWLWYDHQIAVHRFERGPKLSVRAMTDLRANGRSQGLDMLFLRVGPMLGLTPWFSLATHMTIASDRLDSGAHSTQYRPELDAMFRLRAGDFVFFDRNRFEGILGPPDPLFRYRNMLRVDYAPNFPVGVFVFDEFIFSQRVFFPENRAVAGVRFCLPHDNPTLEVGYMLRSRTTKDDWAHDHIGLVSVVVTTDLTRK